MHLVPGLSDPHRSLLSPFRALAHAYCILTRRTLTCPAVTTWDTPLGGTVRNSRPEDSHYSHRPRGQKGARNMGWHVRTAQSPVPDRQAAQSRAQRAVTCVALEAGRSGDRTSKTPSTSYLKASLTEDKL